MCLTAIRGSPESPGADRVVAGDAFSADVGPHHRVLAWPEGEELAELLGRVEADQDAVLGLALAFGDGHPRRRKLPMAGGARFGTGSPGSGGP
jgi:hypothetical protein